MTAYPQARPNQPNYVPNHAKPRPSVGNVLLGFLGELLITAGVLVGLFVVWQVYYTDVIGHREATVHIASFVDTDTPEVGMEVAEKQYGPAPDESTSGPFGILYVPPWGETYQMPIHEGTG